MPQLAWLVGARIVAPDCPRTEHQRGPDVFVDITLPSRHPAAAACHFPCRGRDMTKAVCQERVCPLCEAAVGPHDIKKIFDPVSALRRTVFAGLLRGSGKEGRAE